MKIEQKLNGGIANFGKRRDGIEKLFPVEEGYKTCPMCMLDLSLDSYHRNKNGKLGRDTYCKNCRKNYDKERFKKENIERREKRLNKMKQYQIENADKIREKRNQYYLLNRYKLTQEEYDLMHQKQNGLCAICGNPPSGKPPHHKLHVDHNHLTDEVRELLCGKCNAGVGVFLESIDYLKLAIKYLEKHESKDS